MKFFIRLLVSLLTFSIGLTSAAVWSALRPSPAQTEGYISIAPIGLSFYAWFPEKGVPENGLDTISSRPAYMQLQAWNAGDESQPEMIDIVFTVRNSGTKPADLMVLAVGDLNSFGLRKAAGSTKSTPTTNLLTERVNIGQQVVHNLMPGETRNVTFANVNLKAMTDKYLHKELGSAEPFELRVRIDARMLDGMQGGTRQEALPLAFERLVFE